jgi:Ca2+-binding EF-hand superfamily protein
MKEGRRNAMKVRKTLTAGALALFVAAAPAAFAKNDHGKHKGHQKKEKQKVERKAGDDRTDQPRFEQVYTHFDANGDGWIQRSEWPGDPGRFDRLDTNRDGRISRTEAQALTRNGAALDEARALDRNRDGMIARSEWRGDLATFQRLDRNGDGYLSETDRYGWTSPQTTTDSSRFSGLDRNRDGVVTRQEWRGNDTSFRQQDRNRDGVLSGAEIR